jgi:hypothetical protein
MPLRRSEVDAIASALARRLRTRRSPVAADLSSRSSVRRIASAVAASLSSRSARPVSRPASRLSRRVPVSRVAATLARRIPVSRIASRLARRIPISRVAVSLSRRIPVSRVAANLSRRVPRSRVAVRLAGTSNRSVTTVASSIANRLAAEGNVRRVNRVSMDAVASAVARRLQYTDQLGTYPVDALASAVARRLSSSRNRRSSNALASSIATRFAQRATARQEGLPANRENDPRG